MPVHHTVNEKLIRDKLTTSNVDQSMESPDVSMVEGNSDQSPNRSTSNEDQPIQLPNVSIVDLNYDVSVVPIENYGPAPYTLRQNIFEQVVSWMRKKQQAVYEQVGLTMEVIVSLCELSIVSFQYSHAVNLTMIVVTPSNKESTLSVGVRCPVCRKVVPCPFVRGNGTRSDYNSQSNFQRHLVCHTQSNKCKRVTRSSTGATGSKTTLKIKEKTSRSGKRKRRNDTSSESEDSDPDHDKLAKELTNNYLNESDDLVEDDVDDAELVNDDVTADGTTKDCAKANTIEEGGPSTRTTNKTKTRKK